MRDLLQYCRTDKQREMITSWYDAGENAREAARVIGLNHAYISKTVALMRQARAEKTITPDIQDNKIPDGYIITNGTMQIGPNGVERVWPRYKVSQPDIDSMMEAMAADLPRIPPIDAPGFVNDDLMAVYPLGDPHIGVLCWAMETGMDWDLKIAERSYLAAFDRIVRAAPPAAKAVIVNLGDYFHADNLEAVTTRSGHHLDTDGRYAKMIDIGVTIIRRMIETALAHHATVHVISAVGNHDDTGALFLSVALANIYENNPRVTIDKSPGPFNYVRHGKTFIGVHHGHTCKMDKLPGVMAADRAKDWGESEFRYWLTGHIHHDSKKEMGGCTIESFRTLAAKDAYANAGGYRALQDVKCLVMHNEHGEIERHTVNLSMIK